MVNFCSVKAGDPLPVQLAVHDRQYGYQRWEASYSLSHSFKPLCLWGMIRTSSSGHVFRTVSFSHHKCTEYTYDAYPSCHNRSGVMSACLAFVTEDTLPPQSVVYQALMISYGNVLL